MDRIDISKFSELTSEEQKIIIDDLYDKVEEVENFSYDEFVSTFASSTARTLNKILQSGTAYNNPLYANDVLKDINRTPNRPNSQDLRKWLDNPREFEKNLRDVSMFLEGAVMQYYRSIDHFAKQLSMNYELLPVMRVPTDATKKITYNNGKKKAYEWLRRFRPKEQFTNVMRGMLAEGGKYYYVREGKDFIDLQEMPQDYSYITDRTSIGWAYQFDMTFFYRYPDAFQLYAPEFEYWYQEIADVIAKNPGNTIYVPMPPEKSVVFKFEDDNAVIRPPLSGTFKDAIEIQDYKDLLKTKVELDTWQIIMQEIPKDKDGKPTIDPKLAGIFVALVQAQLPNGVKTASTPLKPEAISFNQSQTMNNIIGTGEQNFWGSVGIAGNQFGSDSTSGIALKYSNLTDYNFVKHMYLQFERFVNYQLFLVTGEYKFKVKFFGRAMFEEEDKKEAIAFAQNGGSKRRLFATFGYEPYEVENMLHDEIDSGLNDLMIPLKTSHTMSDGDSQGGRPESSESSMTESGIKTKDGGYNEAK